MKQRRRTLKNRGYAARYKKAILEYWEVIVFISSCRIKRIEQKDELETEKSQEYRDMEAMQDSNNRMREEVESLVVKYDALKKFAIANKIHIPPELESIH